jgi:phenylalanyl-tRNA synthetase beta chain
LGVVLCHGKTDFTEIKQILDSLFSHLGLEYDIVEEEHKSFIVGRVGRILVKNKKIAYIGEISPDCLEQFNLEQPVAAFELNLTELFDLIDK